MIILPQLDSHQIQSDSRQNSNKVLSQTWQADSKITWGSNNQQPRHSLKNKAQDWLPTYQGLQNYSNYNSTTLVQGKTTHPVDQNRKPRNTISNKMAMYVWGKVNFQRGWKIPSVHRSLQLLTCLQRDLMSLLLVTIYANKNFFTTPQVKSYFFLFQYKAIFTSWQ